MRIVKGMERFAKGKIFPESKSKNTCVIYTRVSTKEQAENNLSLETQRKACEDYSKKHNYKVMAYFGGTYESAKNDEREEFNNMLSFVNKSREKISYIIVFSIDRFSRSGANAIYITEQLKKQGISVISVMQPTDVTTPSGILQQNIQFIFSEYDNQLRREKTITGMRNKFLKGEWCVKPPKGYDIIVINGKRSIVVNKEGELIRKAFLWLYYEKLPQSEILIKLEALGFKTSKQNLSRMFRNPFYCGLISITTLQGKIVVGKHEKLISQELFLLVNDLLDKHPFRGTFITDDTEYPLKRFVKCHKCKSKLTAYIVLDKKLYYYKCPTKGCSNNKSAIEMHNSFSSILNNVEFDEHKYPRIKNEFAQHFISIDRLGRKDERACKLNIGKLKGKLELLEERLVLKEITKEQFRKYSDKISKEIEQANQQYDKIKAGLIPEEEKERLRNGLFKNLAHLWLSSNLEKKRIVQWLIFPEGVFYDKTTNRLIFEKIGKGFYLSEPVKTDS